MAALELSEGDVLNFLVSRGGEVPNAELRKQFRDFLETGDAAMKERSRQRFKQCVNAVATVTKNNGATCVRLRKRYASLVKGGTGGAASQWQSDRRSSQEQLSPQRQGQTDMVVGSQDGQGDNHYLEDRRSDDSYFFPGEEQSLHLNDSGAAGPWASSHSRPLMSAQVGSYHEERGGYYCAVGGGQEDELLQGPVPPDTKPLDFSKGFGIVLVGSSLSESAPQVGEWRICEQDEKGGVPSYLGQVSSSAGSLQEQFLHGNQYQQSASFVSDERTGIGNTGAYAPQMALELTDRCEPEAAAWEAQSEYSNSFYGRPIHGEHWQMIPGAVGQAESNTDNYKSEGVSPSSNQWEIISNAFEPQGRHIQPDRWQKIDGATGQMESSTEQTGQWDRSTDIAERHPGEILPFEYRQGDSVTHPYTDGHRDQLQVEQSYWDSQSLPEHIYRDGNRTLESPDTGMYVSAGENYDRNYSREDQFMPERQRSERLSAPEYYGPAVGVYVSGVEPSTQSESRGRRWSDGHGYGQDSSRPDVEETVGRLRNDVPHGGWEATQDFYQNEPNFQGGQPNAENLYMTLETQGGGDSIGQDTEYWHRVHDPQVHGAGQHRMWREGEQANMTDRPHGNIDDYLELERADQWNNQYLQPGSEITSITLTRDDDSQRAMTKVNPAPFVQVQPSSLSTSQSSRRSDCGKEWRESELDVQLNTPAYLGRRLSSGQYAQHHCNRNDYDEKTGVGKKHTVTHRVDIFPETLADTRHSRRPEVNAPQGKLPPPPPLYSMMSRYLSSSELRSRGEPLSTTREKQPPPITSSSRSRSFPSLRFDIPPDTTGDDLSEKERMSTLDSQNANEAVREQHPSFLHSSRSPYMHHDQFGQRDYDCRQEGSLDSHASSGRWQATTTEMAGRGVPMFIKHALTQGRRPRQRAKALTEKSHSMVNLLHENRWASIASNQHPADYPYATAEPSELFTEKSRSLRDLYQYKDPIGPEGHPRVWNVSENAHEPLKETGRRAVLEKSKSSCELQCIDQPYKFKHQYRSDDHRFSLTDQSLMSRTESRERKLIEKSRSLKDLYQSDQDFRFQGNNVYEGDQELKSVGHYSSVPSAHYVLPEKSASLRDLHENNTHFEHHGKAHRNEREFHQVAARTQSWLHGSLGRDGHDVEASKAMGDVQSHQMENIQDELHKCQDVGNTDTRPKVWTYPPLNEADAGLEEQDLHFLLDREEVHQGNVSAHFAYDDGAISNKLQPDRPSQLDANDVPSLFAEAKETVSTEPRPPSPVPLPAPLVTVEQLNTNDQALIERRQDHSESEDDTALADNLRRVAVGIIHSPSRTRAEVNRAPRKTQQLPQTQGAHASSAKSSASFTRVSRDNDQLSQESADEDFVLNVRRVSKDMLAAQRAGGPSRFSRQGSSVWKRTVAPPDWSICVPQEVSRLNEYLLSSTSRNNLRKQQRLGPQVDKVQKVASVPLDVASVPPDVASVPAVIERGGLARETRIRERSRDRLQPESLSKVQRIWMLSAVRGDFRSAFRVMKTNPDLLLMRDLVSGFTALHWAAKHGDTNALIVLYQQLDRMRPPRAPGAVRSDQDEPRSRAGHTPLHVAAMCGCKEAMRLLVNRFGAFVGARDAAGRRPGQYLPASCSSAEIVALLAYRPGFARPVAAPSPSQTRAAKKTGLSAASSQSLARKSVMSAMFGHSSDDSHFVKSGRPKSSYS